MSDSVVVSTTSIISSERTFPVGYEEKGYLSDKSSGVTKRNPVKIKVIRTATYQEYVEQCRKDGAQVGSRHSNFYLAEVTALD